MREIKKYVRYHLEKRNSLKDQSPQLPRRVRWAFNFYGNRLGDNTGLKIAECDWDRTRQRVKLHVKRSSEVNSYLDLFEQKVNDIYFGSIAKGEIPSKDYIYKELKKDRKKEKPSFMEEWKKYLEIRKLNLKPGSNDALRHSFEHFERFAKGKRIEFEDINAELVSKYAAYLLELGHADNTIHKHIKRLRAFMSYAKKTGLHDNERYADFNVSQKNGRIIFLDWKEVKTLLDYKAETELEQKVLDNFLFGCLTAMRYSDFHALKRSDITQVNFTGIPDAYYAANIRQIKTDNTTVIPILPEALAIIERNKNLPGDFALPRVCNQVINRCIKDIGEKAGINQLVAIDTYKGGKRDTEHKPKHSQLSCHTGRKTFISVAASKSIPIHIVAAIAGHSVKTCMKFYAGVADKDRFVRVVEEMRFDTISVESNDAESEE